MLFYNKELFNLLKMSRNRLLTEILRPSKISQLIVPPRIEKLLGSGEIKMNMLFTGNAGAGKTSAAKVLAQNYPNLYINCSDESGVDVIREKIKTFCSSISVFDNAEQIKVVLLDEFDGVSDQFMKALRAVIESYAESARFIATCNYLNKIPDSIQSRFEVIDFTPKDKEEEDYILKKQMSSTTKILEKLKITANEETITTLVKRSFPDMRKLFNRIQALQIAGTTELTQSEISKTDWSFEPIFEMCINSPEPYKNYTQLVGEYSTYVDDVMYALGTELPNWLAEKYPSLISALPQIIVEVAHHQAQKTLVIDPTISMLSLVYKIQIIVNTKK